MKSFFSKFILPFLLLGLVAVLGFGTAKQAKRNYDLHAEVSGLEQEISALDERNNELRAQIDNFQDPSTIDKEARKRLNLKKDGEEVVIILPPQGEKNIEITEEAEQEPEKQNSFWQIIKSWFE